MKSHPSFLRRPPFGVLALLVLLVAASPVARAESPADTKAREELRQLKTIYEEAINRGDLAPLAALFAENTSGVTVDNQSFKTLAELQEIYRQFRASFPGVVYRVKLNYEPSQLLGDVAVAHGTCDEYVKTSAGEFSYTSSWTAVLRHVGGDWKLVRSQVTLDPFRNSIVQYFIGKTKIYYGGGALAVGLLVGFFVGRILSHRKNAA